MGLFNARQIYLPYCMQKLKDGRWIVLNREYRPLGYHADYVSHDEHPSACWLKGLTKKRIEKMACRVNYSGPDSTIYFYSDSCAPERSVKDSKRYMERLEIFMKLKKVYK